MGRKKPEVEEYGDVEDVVAELFKPGSRKVAAKYHGRLAVLCPVVVIIPRGPEVPENVAEAIVDGHYVYLNEKTSRKELLEVLGARLKANKARADMSQEAFDDHDIPLGG